MWKLFDFGAASEVYKVTNTGQARNTAGNRADTHVRGAILSDTGQKRLEDLFVQHLKTLETSYPNAFYRFRKTLKSSVKWAAQQVVNPLLADTIRGNVIGRVW